MPNLERTRRSPRAPAFDYATPGAYFITIVCQERRALFGAIADGTMVVNEAGQMLDKWWREVSSKFPSVTLDEFVVMPNHVHGLLWLVEAKSRGRLYH